MFPVRLTPKPFHVEMPEGAEILCVQVGRGPEIWALVDTDPAELLEERSFHWLATGEECTGHPGRYIGTVQFAGRALAYHLFEVEE
jgi:hypothetical protein